LPNLSKKDKIYDITTARRRTEPLDEIEAELRTEDRDLAREARRLRLQEIVERRKKKLKELKESGESVKQLSQVGTDMLSGVMQMAQIDPVRAKEFLGSLSQEDIAKLSMLSASSKSGGSIQALLPFLKSKETSIKDIVSIVKMMQQQPTEKPLSLEGIASLLKVLQEVQRPTAQSGTDPYTAAYGLLKPFFETISNKDREFYKTQLDYAKSQNVDPIQYLLRLKEVAPQIGFVPASQSGQPNLELEKMRIGHERWKYEQEYRQRKEYQEMQNKRASEKERNKLIKDIAVPALKRIGPALDAAVKAGQRKINTLATPGAARNEMVDKFLCPKCLENGVQSVIDVAGMPEVAKCPTCKATFPRGQK